MKMNKEELQEWCNNLTDEQREFVYRQEEYCYDCEDFRIYCDDNGITIKNEDCFPALQELYRYKIYDSERGTWENIEATFDYYRDIDRQSYNESFYRYDDEVADMVLATIGKDGRCPKCGYFKEMCICHNICRFCEKGAYDNNGVCVICGHKKEDETI